MAGRTFDELIAGYRAQLISPVDAEMQALVERLIVPNADAIVRDMFALRAETDAFMLPRVGGAAKPDEGSDGTPAGYPVSYCLEITRHMLHLMSRVPAPAHMTGLEALHAFARAGGTVKRVWGALRGSYFQNAIQVGSYYLDVANDTVNPKKDKVELLPLSEANFRNVESYFEFEAVARAYWKCHTLPNRYFPNLAPFYPILVFSRRGAIRLESVNSFMFPMNIVKEFEPARAFVFGDRSDEELDPYVAFLARLAARDARMSDPEGPLYFSAVPEASRLEGNFARVARFGPPGIDAAMERLVGVDRVLWRVPAVKPAAAR